MAACCALGLRPGHFLCVDGVEFYADYRPCEDSQAMNANPQVGPTFAFPRLPLLDRAFQGLARHVKHWFDWVGPVRMNSVVKPYSCQRTPNTRRLLCRAQ